jgi:hypothetical protein
MVTKYPMLIRNREPVAESKIFSYCLKFRKRELGTFISKTKLVYFQWPFSDSQVEKLKGFVSKQQERAKNAAKNAWAKSEGARNKVSNWFSKWTG